MIRKIYYNRENQCDNIIRVGCSWRRCPNKLERTSKGHPMREYDKNRDWTGKWLCQNCFTNYSVWSKKNTLKLLANRRTDNLTNLNHIFADNCQKITCEWTGSEDLNKKNDNFNSLYDHSPIPRHILVKMGKLVDLYGKVPQTKGAKLTVLRIGMLEYEKWTCKLRSELIKEFDYIIFYCISKDGDMVERIYIIPRSDLKTTISIYRNSKYSRWEEYRIRDECVISINSIWQEIVGAKKG